MEPVLHLESRRCWQTGSSLWRDCLYRTSPLFDCKQKLKKFKKETQKQKLLKGNEKQPKSGRNWNKWKYWVNLLRFFSVFLSLWFFAWGKAPNDTLNTKILEETYNPAGLKKQSTEFRVPTTYGHEGGKTSKNRAKIRVLSEYKLLIDSSIWLNLEPAVWGGRFQIFQLTV